MSLILKNSHYGLCHYFEGIQTVFLFCCELIMDKGGLFYVKVWSHVRLISMYIFSACPSLTLLQICPSLKLSNMAGITFEFTLHILEDILGYYIHVCKAVRRAIEETKLGDCIYEKKNT